jgi:hypothetical protein
MLASAIWNKKTTTDYSSWNILSKLNYWICRVEVQIKWRFSKPGKKNEAFNFYKLILQTPLVAGDIIQHL